MRKYMWKLGFSSCDWLYSKNCWLSVLPAGTHLGVLHTTNWYWIQKVMMGAGDVKLPQEILLVLDRMLRYGL